MSAFARAISRNQCDLCSRSLIFVITRNLSTGVIHNAPFVSRYPRTYTVKLISPAIAMRHCLVTFNAAFLITLPFCFFLSPGKPRENSVRVALTRREFTPAESKVGFSSSVVKIPAEIIRTFVSSNGFSTVIHHPIDFPFSRNACPGFSHAIPKLIDKRMPEKRFDCKRRRWRLIFM